MLSEKQSPMIDADGHVLMEGAEGWLEYFTRADAVHMESLIIDNRRHWYKREHLDKEADYAIIHPDDSRQLAESSRRELRRRLGADGLDDPTERMSDQRSMSDQ